MDLVGFVDDTVRIGRNAATNLDNAADDIAARPVLDGADRSLFPLMDFAPTAEEVAAGQLGRVSSNLQFLDALAGGSPDIERAIGGVRRLIPQAESGFAMPASATLDEALTGLASIRSQLDGPLVPGTPLPPLTW